MDPPFHFRLTPLLVRLLGLDAAGARALVERAGLPPEALAGAITAPLSAVRALLEAAADLAGEDIGLRLAEAVPEGTYETAELLVRTAPTLAVGLEALCRTASLINPIGRFEVRGRGDRTELHYFVSGQADGLGPHMNEYSLALVLRGAQRMSGPPPLVAIEAWLPRAKRRGAPELAQHFGCPVRYGASTLGFAIARARAEAPRPASDPVVFRFLERLAEERLRLLGDASFAATVIAVIERGVGLQDADLERVAQHMSATPRTVQRRLEDEGTSFREVLDEVRRRSAERLIAAGLPAARVAELLGFAEVRSYRRALKRWSARSADA